MKAFKGVIWGTVLGLCLTAALAWAQAPSDNSQPPDQQVQPPQAQPPQDQAEPAEAPAPQPPDQAGPNQPPASQDQAEPPAGQPGEPSGPRDDAPGRVARLQYMSGSVSIQPQGTGDWVSGSVNRPLTDSDNVWTDKDSRAELNVGTGILRMSNESSLTIGSISDNQVQVELHQGTLDLRVRQLFNGEVYEVDTPNLAFTVQKNGEYRIDVDPNGDASVVTVWKGEGDATGNGPAVVVKAHERVRFINGTSLQHEVSEASSPDGFDDWCKMRDEHDDHSVSAQYVAPGVIGAEDLDEYGTWRAEEPYGEVWVPSGVAAGWAPYTYGHWVWISPWGWTWVDDEPWGFAPFHYGRWVYGDGFWGWAPGPYYARPFYAPALVAWFGGPRFGIGFGFGFGGGIGWCPLGWGEPFFPWYRGSWGYFSRVNIYNTRITNINRFSGFYHGGGFAGASFQYANLHAPGGAIAVPRGTLTNSLSVRGTAVRVPATEFGRSSLGGQVPVSPSRTSGLGPNASRASAASPSRSFARPVVGSRAAGAAAGRFDGAVFASGHSVPRPPQAGVESNRSAVTAHNYVPRPPAGARIGAGGPASAPRSSPEMRSTPRAPSGGSARPGERSTPRSSPESSHSRTSSFAPQSSGPARSAPSNYASNAYRGGSSSLGYSTESHSYAGAYSRSYGSYGESPRYSSSPGYRSSVPSYRTDSGRSYSAPSSQGSSGSHSSGSSHSSGGGGHSGHR
jgi:hypothetical protein